MNATFGSLFAGIGGIDLGLERAGWKCRWQVENNTYCLRILEKHWPDVPKFGDVKEIIDGQLEPVDLICGGFPCQPVSCAGKRKAQADERWLWPEFARIIRMVRPRFVLVENVPGILSANEGRAMGEVLGDLAACGYDAEWNRISAASVGAPHRRERIFIVAYPNSSGLIRSELEIKSNQRRKQTLGEIGASGSFVAYSESTGWPARTSKGQSRGCSEDVANPTSRSKQSRSSSCYVGQFQEAILRTSRNTDHWAVEPDVGRVAHGVPARVDRLRCLGNAVVPAVAQYVGERILAMKAKP